MEAVQIRHRHLLDLEDWSASEIESLWRTTDAMMEVMQRKVKKVPSLQGFTVATLFFENSTRTRLSFERAAKVQSAEVLNFAAGGSSLSKGESLKDTLRTIDAMQADLYIVRHVAAGTPYQLSRWTDASIVNAGDGRRAHPTQALLDGYTFRRCFEGFDGFRGKRLTIVGDVMHSRVARSNISLWTKLGAEVVLCGPRTLLPAELEQYSGVRRCFRLEEAIEGAHAVMALRMQRERMQGGLFPSLAEYQARYQVTTKMMERAHPHAIVMHPGPMNRDVEIEGVLADSERSVIEEQVAHGVPVRMAVLYSLLVGRGR
ncbi:MAG: aspartate carbamoyltransferase catalytic subunit [Myxococcales bacterium]|nr:aspartate carbamoyltransferase catalytic subunit [Myxococcales bacterium]MCB9642515.1 aspartate carbamoyltransferase catalytic subunit [Myxococcales bacterium]